MIRTFADRRTERIYHGKSPKGIPPELLETIRDKLTLIDMATGVHDLRSPPSNRLEPIRSIPGLYAIRVNRQYRITFRMERGEAEEVRFVDYHA